MDDWSLEQGPFLVFSGFKLVSCSSFAWALPGCSPRLFPGGPCEAARMTPAEELEMDLSYLPVSDEDKDKGGAYLTKRLASDGGDEAGWGRKGELLGRGCQRKGRRE